MALPDNQFRQGRAAGLDRPGPAGETTVYSGRQLIVSRTEAPWGLRFTGEIDVSNVDAVFEALRRHGASGELHLDLSRLLFCDVSGIRALVIHAARRGAARRLLLHGLPADIERVLDVVGWSEMPGLAFCACGAGR
jgi:anti-anti-sigma factor